MFPQIFGKYVLEGELSSGGMAVVYLATLRGAGGFEKRLVVKQIRTELASDEAFVRRFVAEAKTTVELSHSNIVPVYELGVEQGVYFIAMELAAGATLSDLLRDGGALSPEEGAYLGVEICRGLDYAHRKAGIVHRDVTPRNVIIDEEGAVRIIDFGIAAPVTGEGPSRERVFGSPGHMPREQLRGGRLTPATDVFAAAALLVEAWTDRAPFRRESAEASEAALAVPPPLLSASVPALAPLDELIARAVSDEPAERPQSAEDLARPLRDFLRPFDLGDIARRLGERARRARKGHERREGRAPSSATPSTPHVPLGATPAAGIRTPATPVIATPPTQTFATRAVVSDWTRGSGPISADAAAVGRSLASSSSRVVSIVAAGIGLFSVGLLAWVLTREAPPRFPHGDAHTEERPVELAAPSPASLEPVRHVEPPASSPRPAPSVAAPEASLQHPVTFNLTADLPARVTIDGAGAGVTPVRNVRRPSGRHVVGFTSVALGENMTTQVVAEPGAAVSVHAEFTKASPSLRVRTTRAP